MARAGRIVYASVWIALLLVPVASAGPLAGTPEIVNLAHHGDLPDLTTHTAAADATARFVAFTSFATDILPDQPEGCQDAEEWRKHCILLYVKDLDVDGGAPRTWMVTNAAGEAPNDSVSHVTMSADGATVFFETRAWNLGAQDTNNERDVYAYDRATGALELISVCMDGQTACGGGAYSLGVTSDGRFVSFASKSPDLAPGDTDESSDVFVRDRVLGTTERVSLGPDGQETDAPAEQRYGRGISDDGRFVVFGTKEQGWTDVYDPDCKEATGSHSTGPCRHLYVFDRESGRSQPLALGADGVRNEEGPFIGWLSGDGTMVAYGSVAPIVQRTDPERQAYIEDLATGEMRMISTNADGEPADTHVWLRTITPDMRYAMLQTAATNLVDDETVHGEHVYIKDLDTGAVWRLADPNLENMDAWFMDMAPDLSWISFMAHPTHQEQNGVTTQKVFGLLRDLGEGAASARTVVGPEPEPLDHPMSTTATAPSQPPGPASRGGDATVEASGLAGWMLVALVLGCLALARKR